MPWSNCVGGKPDTGDTAWMLFATTFVMLQTPATGLCQAGLVRRKNAVSVLAQTMLGVAMGAILWFIIGFSLTFGDSQGGFIGNLNYLLLINVDTLNCHPNAPTIPAIIFISYQMMFALMVPVLVTGSWAERMHFKSFVIFTLMWPFLVYYPIAHAFWNKGGYLAKWGVLDFAGGLVIHATSGVAGLVVSLMLEKRKQHKILAKSSLPHNVPLMVIGGALIWAGWYSFNGGSALAANYQAVNALMATQLSASAGACTWAVLSYFHTRRVTMTSIISGALGGLAGITAASGFISAGPAALAGFFAGLSSFYSVALIRTKLYIDDVLDVTALQAVPGISGALMVGMAADPTNIPGALRQSTHEGLFIGGSPTLLFKQLVAIVLTCVWTAVATWIVFFIIKITVGINIDPETEELGLDICDHGESAYDDEAAQEAEQVDKDTLVLKMCQASSEGSIPVIAKLIRQGANPAATDFDLRTPLHAAAAAGQLPVMQYLYSNFADQIDIHAKDRWGQTPIQCALRGQRDASVAWLRAMGGVIPLDDVAELMCEAASTGDLVQIRKLTSTVEGSENVVDYDFRSPLHIAATYGFTSIVKYLIDKGANPHAVDRWGNTPVMDAEKFGHYEICQLFSEKNSSHSNASNTSNKSVKEEDLLGLYSNSNGNSTSNGAGHVAISVRDNDPHSINSGTSSESSSTAGGRGAGGWGKLKSAMLVEGGGSGEGKNVSLEAVPNQAGDDSTSPLIVKPKVNTAFLKRAQTSATLLSSGDSDRGNEVSKKSIRTGVVELISACATNDLIEVKRLIKKNVNPNDTDFDGRGPLHFAAAMGHLDIVKYLVGLRGINVNIQDRNRTTPLAEALAYKHLECADVLVTHGATRVDGVRGFALCRYASKGDIEALRKIHETGTNMSIADYDGRTAMHLAACYDQVDVLKFLLSAGGDVNITDKYGSTPLLDAIREKNDSAIGILKNAGAWKVSNEKQAI